MGKSKSHPQSPEARAKISAAMRGQGNPAWGKHLSAETKAKISAAMRGKRHSQSPETRAKISAATRGERHHHWGGGRKKVNGYILIYSPGHPYHNHEGYVPEHRLVMEDSLGRILMPEEKTHHINGIRNDNRIENLMLFANQGEHMAHHNRTARRAQ